MDFCARFVSSLGWFSGLVVLVFLLSLLGFALFLFFGRRYLHGGVREYIEDLRAHKRTIPTMGGVVWVVCLIGVMIPLYLFTGDNRLFSIGTLLLGSALIGGWDDVCKIFWGRGITEKYKFIGQVLVGVAALLLWYWAEGDAFPNAIVFNTLQDWALYIGRIGFFLWSLWVMLSTYNCVNFTDGLDGLAGGVLLVNFLFFGLFALFLGDYVLAVVLASLVGMVLAFLWFNMYPAVLFMGDVGALSLGALLALLALMLHMELAILLVGIVFVLNGVSVILQILGRRFLGRRIFLLAPIHHHFEKKGYPEIAVTTRSIILTLVMACLAAFYYLVL